MNAESLTDTVRAAGLGAIMRGAGLVTRFIPLPQPTLLVGRDSSGRLGQAIAGFGHKRILIVTGPNVSRLGLFRKLTEGLDTGGAEYVVFDEMTPDAPIPVVEKGLEFFHAHDCDAIVAFGGGSPMDAAKVIALAATNPKPLRDLAGYFKGLRNPIQIYAVPTTSGTGSEVTVAAVISDPEKEQKLVVVDPRLVPRMAALDPELMTGLPPQITAATGMDALTHAIESFVGRWSMAYSDDMALAAVGLIFASLPVAYRDGKNLDAREKMALAATYAGFAFTRANVGYVHAIAHQFGARYHTPHGLANAIMLPHVLRYSRPAIVDRLALLAVRAKAGKPGEPDEVLADKFLDAVERLARQVGIPKQLDALQEADIPALAKAALWEAHTGYPVPRYMSQEVCEELIRQVLTEAPARPGRTAKATRATPRTEGSRSKTKTARRPEAATESSGASKTRTARRAQAATKSGGASKTGAGRGAEVNEARGESKTGGEHRAEATDGGGT